MKLEEGISEQRVEMKMGLKYIAEGENNVLSHEAVHKFSITHPQGNVISGSSQYYFAI